VLEQETEQTMKTRRRLVVAGLAALALIAFVIVWFEPQALFIDDRVDEPLPGAEQPVTVSGATAEPGVATVVAEGALRGVKGHDVRGGTAQLHRLADGSHVLRLDELDAQNGPDLHVYLSAAPADGDSDAHDDDYVEVGTLRGNIGSSNYAVPRSVDLDRYRTAVIWCERFSVGFAVARLGPTT
jgi:hypothetical protein